MKAHKLTRKAQRIAGSTPELAERLGVSRRAVQHWMKGRRQPRRQYVKAMQEIVASDVYVPEGVVEGP
jgi:DNA-binding transcriptional regulator YiaG